MPAPLTFIRAVVSGLILIHGITRVVLGGVGGFGEFLSSQGLPFGPALAVLVTSLELLGAPLLALGLPRLVTPLALVFAAIYAGGIWLVHAPEGWFVVGAGRNGVEYSVLLIACLLAIAHAGRRP